MRGFLGSFAGDWRWFVTEQDGVIGSEEAAIAEHNAMAERYIDIIANGLQEFDNFSLTTDQYRALAWEGLISYQPWNNLSRSERYKIGVDYQSAINASSITCN